MPKCELCGIERTESEGKKLSARGLSGLEPRTPDIKVVGLHSVATSIIMFNNPPDSADIPMWWICSECISRCFTQGRSRASLEMEKSVYSLVTGHKSRKWWQFWK